MSKFDPDRANRARRVYEARERAEAKTLGHQAVARAQEEAARREAFMRANMPVYQSATEEALRSLESQGFPGIHPVQYYSPGRDFLIIHTSGRHVEKLGGWEVYRRGNPDGGSSLDEGRSVFLMVDGTYVLFDKRASYDDRWNGAASSNLSLEQMVACVYEAAAEPDMGPKILESLSRLGQGSGENK